MKGLILSGGSGRRMRAVPFFGAKQLIPVANKPVLFYGIEALRDVGLRNIGVVVGDSGDDVAEACGDGSRWGVRLTYIRQEAPLGLAHAILVAESFLGEEPFVLYLGDNILEEGLVRPVEEFLSKRPHALLLLGSALDPERFGVALLENGRISRIIEKSPRIEGKLALVGVYIFDKSIFEAVKAVKPSRRNELEMADALQYLIDRGYTVIPRRLSGWWKDIGRPKDILEANRQVLGKVEARLEGRADGQSIVEGPVIIESGATIRASLIRGPVVIGKDTEIVQSEIGPFVSIQESCRILGARIEDSVILGGCTVRNMKSGIRQYLIGRDPARPEELSFVSLRRMDEARSYR